MNRDPSQFPFEAGLIIKGTEDASTTEAWSTVDDEFG